MYLSIYLSISVNSLLNVVMQPCQTESQTYGGQIVKSEQGE